MHFLFFTKTLSSPVQSVKQDGSKLKNNRSNRIEIEEEGRDELVAEE